MDASPQPTAADAGSVSPDRRRVPRHRPLEARSALGTVQDLSERGMRVLATQPPPLAEGDRFKLEVRQEHLAVLLPVRLVTMSEAEGRCELRLSFEPLDEQQAEAVRQMMRSAVRVTAEPLSRHQVPVGQMVFHMSEVPHDDQADQAGGTTHGLSPHPAAPQVSAPAESSPTRAAAAADHHPEGPQAPQDPQNPQNPQDPQSDLARWLGPRSTSSLCSRQKLPSAGGGANDGDGASIHHDAAGQAPGGTDGSGHVTATNMAAWDKARAKKRALGGREQRRHGRIVAADTHTSLGHVMDISASGMRVRRRGGVHLSIGDAFDIRIHVADRVCCVPVEVVRKQKIGWLTTDVGLRFKLTEAQRRDFGQIARLCGRSVAL